MTPGRREQNKARTRAALEAAALDLFDEQGFDVTSVGEIASAAGVSTRTFFRYYPSKVDVLLNDEAERLRTVRAILADRPADEPVLESIEVLMVELTRDLGPERRLLAAQVRHSGREPALLGAIRRHHFDIVAAVSEFAAPRLGASPQSTIQATVIAAAAIGVVVEVVTAWVLAPDQAEPDMDAAIKAFRSVISLPAAA